MKAKKKIISLIEEKIPEKDLFNRIETKIEIKEKQKRRFNIPLFTSLTATCAVLLVVGVTLIPNALGGNLDAGKTSSAPTGDDATIALGTSAPGYMDDSKTEAEVGGEDYCDDTTDTNSSQQYQKTLTATEYSDLENYSYWLSLINGKAYDEKQNLITNFKTMYDEVHLNQSTNYAVTKNKIDVVLKDKNNQPISLASVKLYSNNNLLYEAVSNAKGVSNLYHNLSEIENFDLKVTYQEQDYWYNIDSLNEENIYNLTLDCEKTTYNDLDLVFLIDTTGSMWDELTYIQNELTNILDAINEFDENYSIKVGLCFYRDIGDNYVTKVFDLNDNIPQVVNNLGAQISGGGGDYEEALQKGLEEINEMSWRENSTKIAFHIFDAPSHQADYGLVYEEYFEFASKGIRYIPVAASGLTIIGEFIAREGSILTGGTYTSLTDDSGIGGSHIDITTPTDTKVEYLNDMIVRLVLEYMTGEDQEIKEY